MVTTLGYLGISLTAIESLMAINRHDQHMAMQRWLSVPRQLTPASSLCSQLCVKTPLHCSKDFSPPSHFTSSMMITSVPSP